MNEQSEPTPPAAKPDLFGGTDQEATAGEKATSTPAGKGAKRPTNKRQTSPVAEIKAAAKSGAARLDGSARAVEVPASALVIHPSLGIFASDFEASNDEAVAALRDQLSRGIAGAERPQVIELAGGTYGAITGIDAVVAAMGLAAKNPKVRLGVLLVTGIDGAHMVVEQLSKARGRSGWEQHQALKPVFGTGGVRETLRSIGLEPKQWESKVSKVLKVGKLPPEVLDRVVLLTIPVKEAGQVVDAWNSPERRVTMEAVLAAAKRAGNARVPAPELFKALLSAGKPEVVMPEWQDDADGSRVFRAVDGAVLATMTMTNGRWTATGAPLSAAQWQAFTKGVLKATG